MSVTSDKYSFPVHVHFDDHYQETSFKIVSQDGKAVQSKPFFRMINAKMGS